MYIRVLPSRRNALLLSQPLLVSNVERYVTSHFRSFGTKPNCSSKISTTIETPSQSWRIPRGSHSIRVLDPGELSLNLGPRRSMNMCQAINDALHIALQTEERSCVFGEDVSFGGVFRCTAGLREKFGPHRVFNTPLSEQGIAGFAIGMATTIGSSAFPPFPPSSLRPSATYSSTPSTLNSPPSAPFTPSTSQAPSPMVIACAEIQFADYLLPALDQIASEAARMRFRSGGDFACGGLTIRAPCGAVGHGGLYHSQSPEALLAHIPGIRVVVPSGPAEAKGLLLASLREPDPVVFFEPKILYRRAIEEVPECDYEIPLGKGRIACRGSDVTLVGWGSQLRVLLEVAEEFSKGKYSLSSVKTKPYNGVSQYNAGQGFQKTSSPKASIISCEVIDLRSLQPWDCDLICSSVNKTGRLIVSHEASESGGFGAEIVARVSKKCFDRMRSPPMRIAGSDIPPIPAAHEGLYLPGKERVVEAVLEALHYG